MNEMEEPTEVLPVLGGTSENIEPFPNQYLDACDLDDVDETPLNKCKILDDGGDDVFTDTESSGRVENGAVKEVTLEESPNGLFSDADSRISHNLNFIDNENRESKKRELQKWIQSVERSSGFGENCELTMDGNLPTDTLDAKGLHQNGMVVETQTDWEWVKNALIQQKEEEEKPDEDESDDEDEEGSSENQRSLSFNSNESSDEYFTPTSILETDQPTCLPHVEPPKILQYMRESEKDAINVETNKVNCAPVKSRVGLCDFCQKPMKPLPTLEEESALVPEELYCCEEYQKFLEMILQSETEEAHLRLESQMQTEERIKKSERNSNKERILNKKEFKNKIKTREVRLRQKQETFEPHQQQQPHVPPQGYHSTRQMNTINYQLSSRRCLEEGWTVRTPYLEQMDFEEDIFEVEPGKIMSLWRGMETMSEGPLEKFYDNGQKFFTIFADGTGNIFYPTGRLAVLITATKPCHFTYVIYHEGNGRRQVAAIFEHTGYGSCYHDNRNVRLYIDPSGGIEANEKGEIKRRWQWHQPGNHVHAPPLQPIHVALNKSIAIKLISQRNIQLNFFTKKRSCKINMGVNVKPVNVMKSSPLVQDENDFYLEDKKTTIECLLSKVQNLIQYSHSPKLERILPPIYLTNKASKLQQQTKQVMVNKKRPKVIVRSEIPSGF